MKKGLLVCFSMILVLSLLLASTGTVTAAPLNGGPSISASSGGGTATLTTIPLSKLPGTEANGAGNLFPQGHASGDMVFSGSGLQVSGLVGYATLSMPLANYVQGWNGSIYQWLNNAWVKLPTTVTQDAESSNGTASATIYSNGIYALIVEFKLPDEVAKNNNCPKGAYLDPAYIPGEGGFSLFGIAIVGHFTSEYIDAGDTVTYEIINVSDGSNLSGIMSGTLSVSYFYDGSPDVNAGVIMLNPSIYRFTYDVNPTFTLVVHYGECTLTARFPKDFTSMDIS